MMKLTDLERNSALWLKVSGAMTERLQMLREMNDSSLTADETAKMRGRISEIKLILEWANPDPQID